MLTAKISDNALNWIRISLPKSSFKQLFLGTRLLLVPVMSASAKSPVEGLKDSECKRGSIANGPSIPYVPSVDPNEEQEKTEIKVKLRDKTNNQMVAFRTKSMKTTSITSLP